MKAKKEKRFIIVHEESPKNGPFASCTVIVDKLTGVNYLAAGNGSYAGLTPLLDREGKPIITSVASLDE